MLAAAFASTSDVVFLFSSAGLVLYIASRAAVDGLTNLNNPSPGRMALGHWMPIAWVAVLATLAGRQEVGIGIVFGTSVAAMTLVMGLLLSLSPPIDTKLADSHAWLFALPAGMLPLLAGFAGVLSWSHALMMLFLGGCILTVWRGRPGVVDSSRSSVDSQNRLRRVQVLLSIGIAVAGARLLYKAILTVEVHTGSAMSGLISVAVASPLLVLPMLGTTAIAARQGHGAAMMETIVGVVLLNLLLLLPMIVFIHHGRQLAIALMSGERNWEMLREQIQPMVFPLSVWRIDNVMLLALAVMLVPASLGRWMLRRPEGFALVFIYAVYVVATRNLAIRI